MVRTFLVPLGFTASFVAVHTGDAARRRRTRRSECDGVMDVAPAELVPLGRYVSRGGCCQPDARDAATSARLPPAARGGPALVATHCAKTETYEWRRNTLPAAQGVIIVRLLRTGESRGC